MNTAHKLFYGIVVTSASLLVLFACTKPLSSQSASAPDMSDTIFVEHNQLPKVPKDQEFDVSPIQDLLTAEIAVANQKPVVALKQYQKISQKTNDIQIIKRGLQIALYTGDYQAAFDLSMRWSELEPNNQQVKDLASALVIEDPHLAFNLLSDAIKERPTDLQLILARGIVSVKLGHLPLAEQDFKTVLKHEPKNIKALSALGYILASQPSRMTDAAIIIQRGFTLEPHNASVLDNMGWLRYQQQNYQEAEKYLRAAYGQEKDSLIAGHLVATLIARGNHVEAKKVWQSAKLKNPHDPNLQAFEKYFAQQ
jgi:Flp pilus assembly protein TadD